MSKTVTSPKEVEFKIGEIDKTKLYSEQEGCNRHIFGAYANLATHNMASVINTILQSVGLNQKDENKIDEAINSNELNQLDNSTKLRVQQKFYRQFPFLKKLKLEDKKDKTVHFDVLIKVLKEFTQLMNVVRNEYSHYYPYSKPEIKKQNNTIKRRVAQKLQSIYENSARIYRQNEKMDYNENEVFNSIKKKNPTIYERLFIVTKKADEFNRLKNELQKNEKRTDELIEYNGQKYRLNYSKDENGSSEVTSITVLSKDYWKLKDQEEFDPLFEQLKKITPSIKGNLRYYNGHFYIINKDGTKITLIGEEYYPADIKTAIIDERDKQLKKKEAQLKEKTEMIEKEPNLQTEQEEKNKKEIKRLNDEINQLKNGLVEYKEGKYKIFETPKDGKYIFQLGTTYELNDQYIARIFDKDKEEGLTDAGVVYFICCFLEKKDAIEFLDEIGFTDNCGLNNKSRMLLKELMCMNRIRMTKNRLDSVMTDTALALDMMNELRKCPKPLYNVLSENARQTFKDEETVKWEREHEQEAVQAGQENEHNNLTDLRSRAVPLSTFVRWDDRFPEMALRYIDIKNMFQGIRFQMRLGKYRFSFYTHSTEDSIDGNESRVRVLQKELHGFGRYNDLEQEVKMKWKNLILENGTTQKEKDTPFRTPYITDQRPQYHIDERSNSIGLRWEFNDSKEINTSYKCIPDVPRSPRPAEEGKRQTNQAGNLLAPLCYLNLDELPSLLFYQYLLDKYKPENFSSAESTIIEYYNNLHRFFLDIVKGDVKDITSLNSKYHLRESDIPIKILKILKNNNNAKQELEEHIKRSVTEHLQQLQARICRKLDRYDAAKTRIGSKDDKLGRKRQTIIPRRMAHELMEDIVMWLPDDCKKNLTGEKYIVIESAIALLGQTTYSDDGQTFQSITMSEIKDMLNKINIIDNHPFLENVVENHNIITTGDFYEDYLDKEFNHTDEIYDQILVDSDVETTKKNIKKKLPFVHIDRQRWQVCEQNALVEQAKQYLYVPQKPRTDREDKTIIEIEKPLQLPLGIFAKPIWDILNKLAENNDDGNWTKLKEELDKINNKTNTNDEKNKIKYSTHLLIEKYHQIIENDGYQEYYDSEKHEEKVYPFKIDPTTGDITYYTNCNPIDTIIKGFPHHYKLFEQLYNDKEGYSVKEIYNKLRDQEELNKVFYGYLIKSTFNDYIKQSLHFTDEMRLKVEVDNLIEKLSNIFRTEEYSKIFKKEDGQTILSKNKEKQDKLIKDIYKTVYPNKVIENDNKEKIQTLLNDMSSLYSSTKRKLKEIEENEHEIRRYQIKDIIMLYMAREILVGKNSNKSEFLEGFQLQHVKRGDALLEKTIDFDWTITVEGSNKKIYQNNMKIKDYGKFYKFATDRERLFSLLKHLADDNFPRADIENEFAHFDVDRSEVFRYVYMLESLAYKMAKERKTNPINLMDDSNDNQDEFWYVDDTLDGGKHEKIEKIINKEGIDLKENEKELKKAMEELPGNTNNLIDRLNTLLAKQYSERTDVEKEKILRIKECCLKLRIGTKAKRINFGELLEILIAGDDAKLDKDEKYLLQHIRNSFGHNHYLEDDEEFNRVFDKKDNMKRLPLIADTIKERISTETKRMTTKEDT